MPFYLHRVLSTLALVPYATSHGRTAVHKCFNILVRDAAIRTATNTSHEETPKFPWRSERPGTTYYSGHSISVTSHPRAISPIAQYSNRSISLRSSFSISRGCAITGTCDITRPRVLSHPTVYALHTEACIEFTRRLSQPGCSVLDGRSGRCSCAKQEE